MHNPQWHLARLLHVHHSLKTSPRKVSVLMKWISPILHSIFYYKMIIIVKKNLLYFFSYSYSVLFTSFNYRIIIFIALSVNFFIIIFSLSLSFLQFILISFVFLIVANECKGLKIFFRMNRNHFIYIYNIYVY